MKLGCLVLLCVLVVSCSPADMLHMQKASAGISADLRQRHGVEPTVEVLKAGQSDIRVVVTIAPAVVGSLTVKQLHNEVIELGTRYLERVPDQVILVITDSHVSIR